jgi:pimeloyl-ACP methyl ester carboxylesterase
VRACLAALGAPELQDYHAAMPFVTAPDGVRLHFELEGTGPPLLLHLGAGCDSDLWRAAGYVEPLAKKYQCILFDHRGHGKSDRPLEVAANHVDRYVDDVIAVLDHLDIGSTHFWGWSNGMLVACAVAERHGPRIRSLILGGAVGRPLDAAALQVAAEGRIGHLREGGWDWLIAGFEEEEGECPEWMKDRIRATDLEQLILWQRARLDWPQTPWDMVAGTQAPSLILVGDLEDPDHLMTEVAALMKDATEIRIEGLGHIKAFLASDRALPHVEAFLAEHSV